MHFSGVMKLIKSAIFIVFLVSATSAMAGEMPKSPLPEFSAENYVTDTLALDEFYIDTITVTSEKSSKLLYDIPASISLFTGYQQESKGIEDLTDFTGLAPGFHMPDYGTALNSPIYIRGVGTRINEPTVGLYVDEIPYYAKATFNFDLYDISRIEILKGPQGTLYGRNSLGGLIKIHTPEPGDFASTELRLGYGSYDKRNIYLKQHRPVLQDRLNMSISANYSYGDGYYQNSFSGETIGGENNLAGRLKLDYNISEYSDIQFILDAGRTKNGGYPYAMTDDGESLDAISYNHESEYRRDLITAGIIADIKLGGIKLNSVSSVQLLDDFQDIDQDFTALDLFSVKQDRRNRYITQELNISNSDRSRLEYVAGLFGYYHTRAKKVDVTYGQDAVDRFRLPGEMIKHKSYDKNVLGGAVFGQLTYADILVKDLKLTGGLRYEVEETELDYLYQLEMLGSKSLIDDFDESMSKPVLLPKVSLHYSPGENSLQYATVTRGYKSGGFNSTIEREEDISFGPEYSTNYEIGFKQRFPGKSFNIHGALFYIEWEDQQVYQPVPSGQGSMLKNAGESHSQGAELEIKYKPARNLILFSNFAYTEAKYDLYKRDSETDYSGNYIPYIPRMTMNLGADYRYRFNSSFLDEMRLHCSYNGIGKHFWNDENTLEEDYYGTVNIRFAALAGNMKISLWGKNVLDNDFNAFLFEFSPLQSSFAQRGLPTRFGMSVSMSFN